MSRSDRTEATTTTTEDLFATVGELDSPPSPSTSTKADYVAAFETYLTQGDVTDGDLVFDDDQAACLAPKWVRAITVDRLREAGVDADDVVDMDFVELELGEPVARTMVDGFAACDIDVASVAAGALSASESSDEQVCARKEVDPTLVDDLFIAGFSGSSQRVIDAAYDALVAQLVEACDDGSD
ncbi:MAG TPA: hypothetical protein VNQ33_10935 [Acidimicrobiales bacterium]|nr:hypothetical protein [Acidimicrobiales bacterium]